MPDARRDDEDVPRGTSRRNNAACGVAPPEPFGPAAAASQFGVARRRRMYPYALLLSP